jgi:hypothetical protein
MAERFGCCSKYVECSDALGCLHREDPEYSGCQYRVNLEAGRIFYGKNAGMKKPDLFIAVKGSNWWSHSATKEQEQAAVSVIRKAGVIKVPEGSGNCTSRVIVEIDGTSFVIYNKEIRLIQKDAAQIMAREISKVAPAKVEVMGAERQESAPAPPPVKKETPVILEQKPVKYVQLSLF